MKFFSWLKNLLSKIFKHEQVPQEPIKPVAPTPSPEQEYNYEKPQGWKVIPILSWKEYEWSKFVYTAIRMIHSDFIQAKDAARLHPNFYALTEHQQTCLFAELVCMMAYYESSWNPKCESVDVGTEDDRDTWSIGLMQMSVCDQQNYGLATRFKFEQVLDPEINLSLALTIFAKQIRETKLLILDCKDSRRYWAVLSEGVNKKGKPYEYSKVREILDKVNRFDFTRVYMGEDLDG